MGLDLPDVKLVVHLQMPLSLADYYQMAGRAGRNGETARSVLICCDADYRTNRYLLQSTLEGSSLERALELLDEMKDFCDEDRAAWCRACWGCWGSTSNAAGTAATARRRSENEERYDGSGN